MSKQVLHSSMSRAAARAFIALATGLALVGPASANVIVVDAGGGGNYTDIQPAVSVASDGDTILVKAGTYSGFLIGDKKLSVVADTNANVHVAGSVQIVGTSTLHDVVLIGLDVAASPTVNALSIANDLGSVRLENCKFTAQSNTSSCAVGEGVNIVGSPDVCFAFCTLKGGQSHQSDTGGGEVHGEGLQATGSNVALYDTTTSGVQAGQDCVSIPSDCLGAFGGDGADFTQGLLFASHSQFVGGAGAGPGNACGAIGCTSTCAGGLGGSGLVLESGSIADLLANTFVPGAAGGVGPGGTLGPGMMIVGNDAHLITGTSRTMIAPSPQRENTTMQLTFTGQPGDYVALIVANETDFVYRPDWKGVLLVKKMHPLLSIPVGTVPASGVLQVPWDVGDIGGSASKVLYLQPLFRNVQTHQILGTPSSMVILSHLY